MKIHKSLFKTFLLSTILLATPQISNAHVGHGDEFQATGGIERVEVKPETDELLGIIVAPIEKASSDGIGVMIPFTSLVEADGKQLVFVKYENFYEPVEVTTGVTEGDYIQVTKELSVGEKLVTQGSLSLYAESLKTQNTEETVTTEEATNSEETATTEETVTTEETTTTEEASNSTSTTDEDHAQLDAEGIPHSHDDHGNLVKSKGFNKKLLVVIGGLLFATIGGGVTAFVKKNKTHQS